MTEFPLCPREKAHTPLHKLTEQEGDAVTSLQCNAKKAAEQDQHPNAPTKRYPIVCRHWNLAGCIWHREHRLSAYRSSRHNGAMIHKPMPMMIADITISIRSAVGHQEVRVAGSVMSLLPTLLLGEKQRKECELVHNR